MAFTIFGQFLDHDIDLTFSGVSERRDIPIPENDKFFIDKQFLNFHRSKFINGTSPR